MANYDFYLTSIDYTTFSEPHGCKNISRVSNNNRDDLMVIKFEPPKQVEIGNYKFKNISTAIIVPRHKGDSLFPINNSGMSVYVLLTKTRDDIDLNNIPSIVDENDYDIFTWAEVFNTRDEAQKALDKIK